MTRVSTHSMGMKCQVCDFVLEVDLCSCGNHHGYTYQQPNQWAANTWPEHECFTSQEPTGG